MVKEDFHVHLHGCLTPLDLWTIGKNKYKSCRYRLDWFATEYEKSWGRRPDYSLYWESDHGVELLKKDYLFTEQNLFARFQANFNLVIALCPITVDGFAIQEHIIRNISQQGLTYFEARTIIPPRFDHHDVYRYLKGLCSLVSRLNKELNMKTKLVFSLPRDDLKLAKKQYLQLKDFIESHSEAGELIEGLDFSATEEGFPPKHIRSLIEFIHQNNNDNHPLKILYHVGESFEDKSLMSTIRWIWEVHELNVSRMGHAIALGVNPLNYSGSTIAESKEERMDTILWLLKIADVLREYGYSMNEFELKKEKELLLTSKEREINIFYNDDYVEECRSLQIAVGHILREKSLIVETCPSSNYYIGQLKKLEYHPLNFFHKKNIPYLVCTDDPGIFNTSMDREIKLAKEIISMNIE